MVSKISETFRTLDGAVDAHVKNTNDDGVFVTGWLIVASLSSPQHDAGSSDGYITYTSEGMPHHSQVGLLSIALDDRRNMSMASTIALAMSGLAFDDDDDYDEGDEI